MQISVIVPVYNEAENIGKLSEEINLTFKDSNVEWECIWVDDGSNDSTWQEIQALQMPNRGIRLRVNSGQSTAIMAGIDQSNYEFIATLDGDGQNDPKDILEMISIVKSDTKLDLVQGFRVKRKDHKLKRVIPSKIANALVRVISGFQVIDLGCSLRVFKRSAMGNFRLTGEMHRLFTLYLLDNGAFYIEVPVSHRSRMAGKTKYGFGRAPKLFADIVLYKALKVIFISPIYTFAKFALIGYLLSFTIFFTAVALRILNYKDYIDGNLASTSIVIFAMSTIFIGLGLVAEMLARMLFINSKSFQYKIDSFHN